MKINQNTKQPTMLQTISQPLPGGHLPHGRFEIISDTVYGLDSIDFSIEGEVLKQYVNSLIDNVCTTNNIQLEVIKECNTSCQSRSNQFFYII